MIFTRAIQGSTNPFFQLQGWQGPVGFDNSTFAMDPLGLNRVEPGALDRQRAYKNADALAGLLHAPIVGADPVVNRTTGMPTGVIPHQDPYPLALLLQLVTAPSQKLGGNRAYRTAIYKAQPDGFFPLPSHMGTPTAKRHSKPALCRRCPLRRAFVPPSATAAHPATSCVNAAG